MQSFTVREHDIFPDEFPESWASDWGEDEYGLFMGFTYKGVRQDFRWIEPGTFMMGSPEDETNRVGDETLHEVTFTSGFWLSDTVVTQALWKAVIGDLDVYDNVKNSNNPMVNVSWYDAQIFINKINELKPDLDLCLPSEAQWEYACRAGTTAAYSVVDSDVSRHLVNFDLSLKQVKSLLPNTWGLYEMHGNVWEWCEDWYGDYSRNQVVAPLNMEVSDHRVVRGGSWGSRMQSCRSASRGVQVPSISDTDIGFRLARGHRAAQSGTG